MSRVHDALRRAEQLGISQPASPEAEVPPAGTVLVGTEELPRMPAGPVGSFLAEVVETPFTPAPEESAAQARRAA